METKHYHFSGICGTAMASLAVLLKKRGHKVTGSDENVYPPMSIYLDDNGIDIMQGYSEDNLKPAPDYVVLGNALSRGNVEVEYALKKHLHYLSMAELLKNDFIRGNTSIVVTGTHGKTTTTSIMAHVMEQCGKKPGFLVGGVPENFSTSARDAQKNGYFIIEGDEYDTSFFDKRSKFFHYLPDRVILNNIEFDHADIFNNLDEIKKSFTLMLRQIPEDGLILANGDDANVMEVAVKGFSPVVTYGFGKNCDAVISGVEPVKGKYGVEFDLAWNGQIWHFSIPLLGEFNVRNATSVILTAMYEGASVEDIQLALSSFKNTKRRLQKVSGDSAVQVYDDFAHHPTAIAATIKAVRDSWPEAKIHTVFEPRSNTSVRKFHQETLGAAFGDADSVVFYKLHREDSIPEDQRLDLKTIVSDLNNSGKEAEYIPKLDSIIKNIAAKVKPGDIVLVMSQGNFEGLQNKIAKEVAEYGNEQLA